MLAIQSSRHLHVQLANVLGPVEHFCCRKLPCLRYFRHFLVSESNDYIFGFEVSMDNSALSMHVVKAN